MEDIKNISKLVGDKYENKASLDVEIEAKTILGYRSVGEMVLDFSIVDEEVDISVVEYSKLHHFRKRSIFCQRPK